LNGFSFNAKPFNHAKLNYIVLIYEVVKQKRGKNSLAKKNVLKIKLLPLVCRKKWEKEEGNIKLIFFRI
jgi:hypothetical protein